jgi:1-acyl-sn-glycerol-3-phosphate acyltransferase
MFYTVVRWIVSGGSRVVYRMRLRGLERVPEEGGFILAPSHRSMMDIPFIAWTTPRPIRYMGKAPVFKVPVLGWLFTKLGGFPVERDGTDRKAVRDSIAMLERGEILLVYPEGSRQHGPKIAPLQPGAAYLALRAGVPIVPVGIAGSEEILRDHESSMPRFKRCAMVVGEPVVPPARTGRGLVPRAEVDALTARLADELQRLLDEAYALRDGALPS